MPTFFEIIAETLARAYEDLSDDKHADTKIKKALENLSAHFNNVLTHGGPSYGLMNVQRLAA